jgi:glutathione peroxidase
MVDRRAFLGIGAVLMAGQAAAAGLTGFSLTRLEGGAMPLSEFAGRVVLVVNTASFCGYTHQYSALQALHDRYEARGLTVLGVPSNDFNQESTDNRRIREFCDGMFGITFPMAGLSPVRGARAVPLYQWLAAQAGGPPRWNFHKYLVARDGLRVTAFSTQVEPRAPQLLRAIEAALAVPAA